MRIAGLIFTLLFLMNSYTGYSFQRGFQYGITLGATGNHSYFEGGSEFAHANFYNNVYGTGALHFSARYFLSERWSLQSGLGFTTMGFESGMAKNYSLLKNDHFVSVRQDLNITQIPLLAIYSFKPDCKNKNWFLGAGINFSFVTSEKEKTIFPSQPGNDLNLLPAVTNFSATHKLQKENVAGLQFMVGREKKFNKGNRLSLAFVWNIGLSGSFATNTLQYRVENTDYEHVFSNRGDFAGLYLTYTFSTKSTRKTAAVAEQR
jgi:hypothetical protein